MTYPPHRDPRPGEAGRWRLKGYVYEDVRPEDAHHYRSHCRQLSEPAAKAPAPTVEESEATFEPLPELEPDQVDTEEKTSKPRKRRRK